MSCLSVYHEDSLVGETHQGGSDDFSSPLSVLELLYKKVTETKILVIQVHSEKL